MIFSYTNRDTDFTEKVFVRVDVTEEFPFLVTKLSLYYDREYKGREAMTLPGFTAEASLGPTMAVYRNNAVFARSGMGEVSLQQFGASSFLGPGSLGLGFTMKCCGYDTWLHRFVCTTRIVSPLEQCECHRDFFGDPYIICRPLVFSAG